mgnify:CR=1 FL=1
MLSLAPGLPVSAQCSPTGSQTGGTAKETFVSLMSEQLPLFDVKLLEMLGQLRRLHCSFGADAFWHLLTFLFF